MAKLVDVYRSDKQTLGRRQLPLQIDDSLTMVMDLSGIGFVYDNQMVKGKELDDFIAKFKLLSPEEIRSAFQVNRNDLLNILSLTVPCVGCRRSVERLFYLLMKSGHLALDPLVILPEGYLTLQDDYWNWPHLVCTLLHGHSSQLKDLVDSHLRSKKSRRCMLHSLDSQRARLLSTEWRDIWAAMSSQCRDEIVLIEASTLMATLENYLRKHRFCNDCRTKVLRAYALLVQEPEPELQKEKDYVAALYAGIKRCLPDKHVHLQTDTEYISDLILRAEPELMGSRRERHAKTLDIAQEEVLTCLGICVYERLHRIHLRMREDECASQVLAAIAVNALSRNFQLSVQRAVECKRGKTQLELLYEELSKEEQTLQQRKEHKKLRRKKRKEKKAGQDEKENNCECEPEEQLENQCGRTDENYFCTDDKPTPKKYDIQKELIVGEKCLDSNDHSQDYGYSSENNNCSSSPSGPSSPEGSEVACSDCFCNHEGEYETENGVKVCHFKNPIQGPWLQQMLEEPCSSDEESYIPAEEVQEFKAKIRHVTEKRQELRQILKKRFAQMCDNRPHMQSVIMLDDQE